ncbi:hypothetical protein M9H77_02806 [Catharanthus roseus]|uniref:Uncharacterized protein n=1 Tax=Catharanthus roseus TaxID=4058 RepID=A0ACC0C9D2_CATRO|nr:hypothetical protein M9H77_02806 [Catharanthus roseus]
MAWLSWEIHYKSKTYKGMIFRDLHAFNLILLFKQSWKVLTEQDSLVLTILNARFWSQIAEALGFSICEFDHRRRPSSNAASLPATVEVDFEGGTLLMLEVHWRRRLQFAGAPFHGGLDRNLTADSSGVHCFFLFLLVWLVLRLLHMLFMAKKKKWSTAPSLVMEKTVMGKEIVEEFLKELEEVDDVISEPSVVAETSPSVSRTLGMEDTTSKSKEDSVNGIEENQPKKTFASLFADNRNPSKGIQLYKIMVQSDVIEVESDEVDDVIETWGFALFAFVVGGFPGFDAINKLTNSWKVHSTFKVHKSGWLVFRFDSDKDRQEVLDKGPYLIFKRPIVMKPITSLFDVGSASMITLPVWVNLPGLPSKDLVTEVTIKLPNVIIRNQDVIFENVPKYCSSCKVLGHSNEFCKRNVDDQAANTQGQSGILSVPMQQSKGDFRPGTAGHSAGMMQGHESGATSGTGLNQQKQMQESTLNQGQQSGLKQGHSGQSSLQQNAGTVGEFSGLIQAQDVEDSSVLDKLSGQELGFISGLHQPGFLALNQNQKNQFSGLNQVQICTDFEGQTAEQLGGQNMQQQNTLDQVQIGADSARKVQKIQPAKIGQNQPVLTAPTAPTVRHHYSLRVDRGNIKSITPTKAFVGFLTQFGNSVHVPWLVPGDFNSVEMIILMFLPMKLETSCVVVWIWGFLILTVQETLLSHFYQSRSAREELNVAQSLLHDNPHDSTLREVLGILPISAVVFYRLISLCRLFLWGGNYARVAWKTMCLSKEHGGLGLKDTRSWNDALLTKILWNIHAKKDTLWCRWIHHVYVKSGPRDRGRFGIELFGILLTYQSFLLYFGLLLWDDFLRWKDSLSCRLIRLARFVTRWKTYTHTYSLAVLLLKRNKVIFEIYDPDCMVKIQPNCLPLKPNNALGLNLLNRLSWFSSWAALWAFYLLVASRLPLDRVTRDAHVLGWPPGSSAGDSRARPFSFSSVSQQSLLIPSLSCFLFSSCVCWSL